MLVALIAAIALTAYSIYVNGLRTQLSDLIGDVRAYAAVHGPPKNASELAHEVAQRFFHPDISVTVFDATTRAEVRGRNNSATRQNLSNVDVVVSPRSSIAPLVVPSGLIEQLATALATLFGLRNVRAEYGLVVLLLHVNDANLGATLRRFIPLFAFAEIAAFLISYLLARLVTTQALYPVVAVTNALERFGAGDLTPHPIAANPRHELAALSEAYNRANSEVTRAFAERDRAQARMRQFISDAGHQLKTPLTVIRGFIGVLKRGGLRDPSDYDHILETMNRQSLLIGSLVDSLILLERWDREDERTQAEPIDVGQLVEDVVTPSFEARPARKSHIAVTDGATAAIDPSDLAHAVTNLVDNAFKYSDGPVDVRVERRNGRVVIAVSDEGSGMTANERTHAFDRFYRGETRRDVEGSGLGLAIAKSAIERAGGTIGFDQSVAIGSRVVIELPAAAR